MDDVQVSTLLCETEIRSLPPELSLWNMSDVICFDILKVFLMSFPLTFALCSCSLPGGEGLSGEGAGIPGWSCHSPVSGVWQSSTLLLLVQRGWTIHLQHGWETQTRYITRGESQSHSYRGMNRTLDNTGWRVMCEYDTCCRSSVLCRSRAVLPQGPGERCRCLRLYLPGPAQHQQESRWNCCHKCVWPRCRIILFSPSSSFIATH